MKHRIFTAILICALVLITLGACASQADLSAGSTRSTQTAN